MREFSRKGTGIQFGKSTGMKMNISSNGNGNWYMGMGGNGNGKPIPSRRPLASSIHLIEIIHDVQAVLLCCYTRELSSR